MELRNGRKIRGLAGNFLGPSAARRPAALLIRSRKDLLERLRDPAVAGGVRMDIAEREPRPVADVCGTIHQAVVFEGACDVGDDHPPRRTCRPRSR